MIKTSKSRAVRHHSKTAEKMKNVRSLVGETGYWVFGVSRAHRRTPFDVIVVKKDNPLVPLWLYPTKKGRVVVRPWRSRQGASQDLYRNISVQNRRLLRLFRSVPMPSTSAWYDWLTRSSRKEAKLLGLLT